MPRKILPSLLTLLLISSALLFTRCETEVDLLAPYKVTPIIYGVLDFEADTQFFRINKTYLGEGDNNLYAGIKDSVEFPLGEVQGWIIKKIGSGVVDSFELDAIDKPFREPGLFYNTNVRFYYTAETLLTPEEVTAVRSTVANRPYFEMVVNAAGETYTAESVFPLINSSSIVVPVANPIIPRSDFYVTAGQGAFRSQNFRYDRHPTAGRYEADLRVVYDVDFTDGTTAFNEFFDYRIDSRDNSGSGITNISFGSRNWYEFAGARFRAIPNVERIRIHYLEYILSAANQDFATYLSVAQPVSQLVPVLSEFTNIAGGAIGLFASRAHISRTIYLTEPSLEQLSTGNLTSGPCYCVTWTGTNYNCETVCP